RPSNLVSPFAAQEGDAPRVEASEDTIAVVLHLVEPGFSARSLAHEGGELGGNELRELRAADPGHVGDRDGRVAPTPARRSRAKRGRRLARGDLLAPVAIRVPYVVGGGGDLLQRSPRVHAPGLELDDVGRPPGARLGVALLDQEPAPPAVVATPPATDPHERPAPAELFPLESELEVAGPVALMRIADGLPGAAVPQEHRPATVLALRDDALEGAVLERLILAQSHEFIFPRVTPSVHRKPRGF